jgi:hypothetical protein
MPWDLFLQSPYHFGCENMCITPFIIARDESIMHIFYAPAVTEKILTFTAHDDIFRKIILGSMQ